MSKPIKVVVVFFVIAAVVCVKNNPSPKTLGQKELDPKNLGKLKVW